MLSIPAAKSSSSVRSTVGVAEGVGVAFVAELRVPMLSAEEGLCRMLLCAVGAWLPGGRCASMREIISTVLPRPICRCVCVCVCVCGRVWVWLWVCVGRGACDCVRALRPQSCALCPC